MRKKSIPFRKFTESFPVFPIFSSIIFIYFTKKAAASVSLRLFYLQISLLSARHCGIIRSAACSITHAENAYQIIRAKPFRPASAASDAAQNLVPSVPAVREKYRRAAHAPPR